jgi:hypothetical protein
MPLIQREGFEMAKYRRKTGEIVEAVQFNPLGKHKSILPEGVTGTLSPGADNWAYEGCQFLVTTIHGQLTDVVSGDWIITEPDGKHHYPCKPDFFKATYELVEE